VPASALSSRLVQGLEERQVCGQSIAFLGMNPAAFQVQRQRIIAAPPAHSASAHKGPCSSPWRSWQYRLGQSSADGRPAVNNLTCAGTCCALPGCIAAIYGDIWELRLADGWLRRPNRQRDDVRKSQQGTQQTICRALQGHSSHCARDRCPTPYKLKGAARLIADF